MPGPAPVPARSRDRDRDRTRARAGRTAVCVVLLLLASGVATASPAAASPPPAPGSAAAPATEGVAAAAETDAQVAARWSRAVRAENAKPGATGWLIPAARGRAGGLEAYADRVSVRRGEGVGLYVRGSGTVRVTAYRLGWYGGRKARVVARTSLVATKQPAGRRTDAPLADAGGLRNTRTHVAPWRPNKILRTTGWPEGTYLLRLDAARASRYVPLTVRTGSARARVLVLSGALTWQAYNAWGGRSLYRGPAGATDRSLAVSFDRPYAEGYGAGRLLRDDAPVLHEAERTGVALAWATDYDLALQPSLATRAAALVFGGHAEYWPVELMRTVRTVTGAGTNLAVFGANTAYWRTRLAGRATAVPGRPARRDGRPRTVVVTRNASLDPLAARDPEGATVRFRDAPSAQPEHRLLGVRYDCIKVTTDWVVTDPGWFGYRGTGLAKGSRLRGVVGHEIDTGIRGQTPARLRVVAYNGIRCRGYRSTHTAAYFTTSGGGAVFSAGTLSWPCAMTGVCVQPTRKIAARAAAAVARITRNVVVAFSVRAASTRHPASSNAASYWFPKG